MHNTAAFRPISLRKFYYNPEIYYDLKVPVFEV